MKRRGNVISKRLDCSPAIMRETAFHRHQERHLVILTVSGVLMGRD
jgi:hypothetical protein